MQATDLKLWALMRAIVPLAHTPPVHDATLPELGFDSIALIDLFAALEDEFRVSPEALLRHLLRARTFYSLVALCRESELRHERERSRENREAL